jgi:hypothetical protein
VKSRPSTRPLGTDARFTVARCSQPPLSRRSDGKSTFPELVDTGASTVEVIKDVGRHQDRAASRDP